jgi:hypothetical protein
MPNFLFSESTPAKRRYGYVEFHISRIDTPKESLWVCRFLYFENRPLQRGAMGMPIFIFSESTPAKSRYGYAEFYILRIDPRKEPLWVRRILYFENRPPQRGAMGMPIFIFAESTPAKSRYGYAEFYILRIGPRKEALWVCRISFLEN